MTLADLLSLLGIIIAGVALYRSKKADDAIKNYQQVQEKLAQLELIRLTQRANLLITFSIERSDDVYKVRRFLVIRNTGNVEARNIELHFAPHSNGKLPFLLDKIAPIPILASGLEVVYEVLLGATDSVELKGTWKWDNPDGTKDEKESYFTIPLR